MKSGFHRVKQKNEQMRSCVNLKCPVLLDRSKFRLRILFRKPKWFSEPFRKYFKYTKRRGKNHAFLFFAQKAEKTIFINRAIIIACKI